MDITDLQTILVPVVLVASAVAVFFDYRKRQRQQLQTATTTGNAARTESIGMLFHAEPIEYAPARKPAGERPLEPVVATVSKPPAARPAARDTVTIQVTGPTDGASQSYGGSSLPAFTIDAALWERLVSSRPRHDLLAAGSTASNPGPAYQRVVQHQSQTVWPTGMIQQAAFQTLLDNREIFSGLVVSIGVNDTDSSMWHSQGLMQSVGTYISGLLREKDFACRTGYDEFILVCAGEQGAPSQRRLNHISEQLWDYQLRGFGTCSILFSWGGVQVQNESLAEAVASAVDRMRQTKRAGSPSGLASSHRKAV